MEEKNKELDTATVLGIGEAQVKEADEILRKYKQGKANLEKRIIENEQWYKLRHWECMRGAEEQVKPTSAWLFNVIANKHADAMDNAPAANILPREEGDKQEAENLSSILPVIPYEEYKDLKTPELAQLVKDRIAEAIEQHMEE